MPNVTNVIEGVPPTSIRIQFDNGEETVVKMPMRKLAPRMYKSSSYLVVFNNPNQLLLLQHDNPDEVMRQYMITPALANTLEQHLDRLAGKTERINAYKGTVSILAGPRKTGDKSMSDIVKSQVEGEEAKERAGVPPDVLRLTSSFLAERPKRRGGRKTSRLPSKSSRRQRSRRSRKSRGGARSL
jgi:hypothetical protein